MIPILLQESLLNWISDPAAGQASRYVGACSLPGRKHWRRAASDPRFLVRVRGQGRQGSIGRGPASSGKQIKTTVFPLHLHRCAWEEPLPLGPQAGSLALRWLVLSCHQRITPKGEASSRASRPHCLREAAEERCRLANSAPLSLRQGGNGEGEPLCEGEEGAGQGGGSHSPKV